MNGTGIRNKARVALLAVGLMAGAGGGAQAQSWDPIESPPAAAPGGGKPSQQLPKEPDAKATPPAVAPFAPPDLVAPKGGTTPGGVCAKADFEAVVDEAAGALRDLNLQNKPAFQEKLRQLKDKRGWSHDAFLKEAAPFVRDDKIAVYDQESERLLADISTLGQEGAEAPTPDCTLLTGLKTRMQTLVDTQTAKWTYMFQKLDTALAQ
jgi:hypothetical protein